MLKSIFNVLLIPVMGFAVMVLIADNEAPAEVVNPICVNIDCKWHNQVGCGGTCNPAEICTCKQAMPAGNELPPKPCFCEALQIPPVDDVEL